MAQEWNLFDLVRPDPYQDWAFEARARTHNTSQDGLDTDGQDVTTWVAALLTVKGDTNGEFLQNLQSLQYIVLADPFQALASDNSPGALRMFDPERERLNKTVQFLERLAEADPERETAIRERAEMNDTFGLYVPEARAFGGGTYRDYDAFSLDITGPPIFGFLGPIGAGASAPEATDQPEVSGQEGAPVSEDDASQAASDPRVVIGIIDDGIAFAHERFLRTPTETRIESIWIQGTEGSNGSVFGVNSGTILNKATIDALLAKHHGDDVSIYRELGLMPGTTARNAAQTHVPLGRRLSHGTHILDVATGTDPKDTSTEAQAMRDVPILAVQLPPEVTADTSGSNLTSYVLQAMHWMMLTAKDFAPNATLVLNFSYGIFAGPKDGTHYLEKWIEELFGLRQRHLQHLQDHNANVEDADAQAAETSTGIKSDRQATYLVLPTGNHYRARATAKANLDPATFGADAASVSMDWVIQPDDGTPSFLEIWLDGLDPDAPAMCFELTTPNGLHCKADAVLENAKWVLCDGPDSKDAASSAPPTNPVAAVYTEWHDDAKTRLRILISVNPTSRTDTDARIAPYGRWTFKLENTSSAPLLARFYVQRDDTPIGYTTRARQSFLDHEDAYVWDREKLARTALGTAPVTHDNTISAIATITAESVLTVGALTGRDGCTDVAPADYSASGSLERNTTPGYSTISDLDAALPGILAAGTLTGSTVAMSGTSVAAPQITRALINELLGIADPLPTRRRPKNAGAQIRQGTPVLLSLPDINRKRAYMDWPDAAPQADA